MEGDPAEPINASNDMSLANEKVVFEADFNGISPNPNQFYTWNGRIYNNSLYDSLKNIACNEGVLCLKSKYSSTDHRWIKQMISTAGFFETDDFDCEFYAKYCNKIGSWNNVITYGTGTYWTNGLYSDALQWPAGGEIDVFEQNTINDGTTKMITPTAHYGSGSRSIYPNKHLVAQYNEITEISDDWHKFRFSLHNGVVTVWIDDEVIGKMNYAEYAVSNEHVYNYHPFLKPQAFYIDGSGENDDINTQYEFYVRDFKIYQKELIPCKTLTIYPQMWGNNDNDYIFPIGAEVFFDKEYYPNNTSNKAVLWKSSDESVATVCQGLVKCVGEGKATIEAKCGNAVAVYEITVNNDNASVPCAAIEYSGESRSYVGAALDLKNILNIFPLYQTDKIQVCSGNLDIATVDENSGLVYLKKAGSTTLSVVCGKQKIEFPIIVGDRLIQELNASTKAGMYKSGIIGELSAGQTYTWIVDVALNNDYDGTNFSVNRTSLFNVDMNSDNVYPQIMFTVDNKAEILLGTTKKCKISISAGDRLAIEISINGNSAAYIYVNDEQKAIIENINPDWFSGERLISIGTTARNAKYTADYSALYFGSFSENAEEVGE